LTSLDRIIIFSIVIDIARLQRVADQLLGQVARPTAESDTRQEDRWMSKQRTELTKLEWILLDALWNAGQATATDLQRALADSRGWAYSTVKTMLDRLVEMGYVKARRVGNVYEYSPKSKRPTVVGKVVDEVAERLFDGATAPFIQCLLERGKLTPQEVEELRAMLENYSDEKGGKS
jgi:predicted transcriptional regulator